MEILSKIDEFVWGTPIIILLVGTGIFLTVGVGFKQFTKFAYWLKNTIGRSFEKRKREDGAVTPFQALCTALAATIGTGNISGIAGAIAIGGPGAVFWMWFSAIFGQITKYAEVLLAIKYRERNEAGDYVGGPMYYIKNGLGKNWRWLAYVFAAFAAFAAFGIGNCTQVDSVTSGLSDILLLFVPSVSKNTLKLVIGIIIAVIVGFALIGGIQRIGQMLEKVVPVMAVIYIVAGLITIIFNAREIPAVFSAIIKGAFNPSSVAGGLAGVGIKTAMTEGISRGLFSNEAGLGSAPIAHAASSETDPVKQALYGIFEVFADTIVVCSFTALIVLCGNGTSGIVYGQSAAYDIVISGMSSVLLRGPSTIIVGIVLSLFAFSTIISWGLYGSRCIEFLLGPKAIKPYQAVFCLFIVCGSFMGLDAAWTLASILNALMSIPNLIAVLALSPEIFKITKEHFSSGR